MMNLFPDLKLNEKEWSHQFMIKSLPGSNPCDIHG